jgi:hypothetical protein
MLLGLEKAHGSQTANGIVILRVLVLVCLYIEAYATSGYYTAVQCTDKLLD